MIPVNIRESSPRRKKYEEKRNEDFLNTNLDLLVEKREKPQILEMGSKQREARRYNFKLLLSLMHDKQF